MKTGGGISVVAGESHVHYVGFRIDDLWERIAAAVSLGVLAIDTLGYLDEVESTLLVVLELQVDY